MSTVTTAPTTTVDLQEATNNPQLTTREAASSPASRAAAAVVAPALPAAAASSGAASSSSSGGGGGDLESSVLNGAATTDDEEYALAESNSEEEGDNRHHNILEGPSAVTYTWQILMGVLSLMAVISLTLITAELINREPFQAAWATIFLWSTTALFFVVILKQQRAQAAAAANEALGRPGVQRVLDKAARQALFTYFVFNPSKDEQKEPNGDVIEREDETTNNAEAPQGSTRPAGIVENEGSARMGSSKWVTNATCIVCLGEYRLGDRLCRMPCLHIYHAKCIDEWLDRAKQPRCPLCKKDLRREVSAVSSATTVAGPSEGVLVEDTASIETV